MRKSANAVCNYFVERIKRTNDYLNPKRNMSERNKAEGDFSRQANRPQNQAPYRSNFLKKLIVFIILLSPMFSGCASHLRPPTETGPIMIPGSMFSLKDGTEFVFAMEYRFSNGIMKARNRATGEEFFGNYTAIFADGEVSKSTYRDAWGGVAGSATTTTTATRGTGKGVLRGDKGTVISVTMDIVPTYNRSIYPSGFGDGTDNHGTHYHLQFGPGGPSVPGTSSADRQKRVFEPTIPGGVYQATRNYGNGDKYEGEFFNGQFHGKGIYTYANGDKYEGEFVDGKFTGKGTFTCSNDKQFKGMIENKVPLEYTVRCN